MRSGLHLSAVFRFRHAAVRTDASLANLVWYGVTLAATIGAFKLSETIAVKSLAAPLGRAELFWLRLFALLLSAKLIPAAFENQAYDALVLLGVLLGLAALSQNRPLAAGAGLALAAALKATPLIFLPYLLWKRYFAAAAAFVPVYALASLPPDLLFAPAGGPGYFSTWLGEVAGPALGVNPAGAPFAFWDGANILNHSLRGAVALNVNEVHHRGLFEAAPRPTVASWSWSERSSRYRRAAWARRNVLAAAFRAALIRQAHSRGVREPGL